MEIKQHATKLPMVQWRNEKYPETNENGNMANEKLRDTAKAVLSEKLTMIQAYFMKQERSQINHLALHLKELEEKRQ